MQQAQVIQTSLADPYLSQVYTQCIVDHATEQTLSAEAWSFQLSVSTSLVDGRMCIGVMIFVKSVECSPQYMLWRA